MSEAIHPTPAQTPSPWSSVVSLATTALPNNSHMPLFLSCSLVVVVVLLLLLLLQQLHATLPVNLPLFGMLPSLLFRIHRIADWTVDILLLSGCHFMFKGPWFLGLDFLLVADPANFNHILNLNHSNYPRGRDFAEIFDVIGDGLLSSDGQSWKSQRRKAHGVMSSRGFRASVSLSCRHKVGNVLLPLMSQLAGQVFDLQDVFMRLMFDLSCTTVLGVDLGCLSTTFPAVPFSKAVDDVEEVILVRHIVPGLWWKLTRWLGVGEEKRMATARGVIDDFLAQHLSKLRDERKAPGSDMISIYLNDSLLEDNFLRDTAFNFLAAGKDLTAATLTWFFLMLYKNPKVEAEILKELSGLALNLKKDGEMVVFNAEELDELVYLHAALCETMRLFAPAPFNHRRAVGADVLPSGHRIGAGTRVILAMYAMGRMERVWGDDCLEFRPERWITEQETLRHEPSYKFVAFSSGPRICVRKDVAFTQMKVTAAAMVYNFKVEVMERCTVEPKLSMILLVKDGLMVKVQKRRGNSAA